MKNLRIDRLNNGQLRLVATTGTIVYRVIFNNVVEIKNWLVQHDYYTIK